MAAAVVRTKVLLLGTEGSGKTTLMGQLQALARSDGREALPPATSVAPTTGQEIESVTFRPAAFRYTLDSDDDDAGRDADVASDVVLGAAGAPGAGGSGGGALTLYEAGGRMMSVWPRYVKSQAKPDGARALIYVVDCSAPTLLPTAAAGLLELLARPERDVRGWRILLLLNKTRMPSALSTRDTLRLMAVPQLLAADPELAVCVAAVDTWSGEGLDDVVRWLTQLPRPADAEE